MSDELTPSARAMQQSRREALLDFEEVLAQHPGAVHGDSEQFPLTHHFVPGVYGREMAIRAGSLLTGKIHREAHLVILLEGIIRVFTEAGGTKELRAPLVFTSPPGVKRAAMALTDTRWLTIHPNPEDTQDLQALEAEIIVPSFAAYEAWNALQSAPKRSLE